MSLPRGCNVRRQFHGIGLSCRSSPASCRVQTRLRAPYLPTFPSSPACRIFITISTANSRRVNPAGRPDCHTRSSSFVLMASLTQHRHHGGHSHSHGHGHSHDNTYLTSTNKKDAGVRITRIGLYVNFLMAIGKGLGGFFLNSQSLMADAFHSLTDLVSDFLTLATVAWSLKAPTDRFPSGYGKIESLGALGVSSLLLAGGLGLGWHSCEILYSHIFLDAAGVGAADHSHHHHDHDHDHSHGGLAGLFGHSHSHNPLDMGIPSIHAAWIAAGSIAIKEYLYRASKSTNFQSDYGLSLTHDQPSESRKSGSRLFLHQTPCITELILLQALWP